MSRPKNKQDLIAFANEYYEKLINEINNRSELEKNTIYDFSNDASKKEAHWNRDKNLRDVLMHLVKWHELMINWVKNKEDGKNRPFLLEGYSWKNYGEMNLLFYQESLDVSEAEALNKLSVTHKKIVELIDIFSEEELFTKSIYPWVGGSSIGQYFISVSGSHYEWASKKIKAHRKNVLS